MHFCTAMVQIAGDRDQIVFRDYFSPISWPEVELLRVVHGDEAVQEVKPFVRVRQGPRDERARLILRYGGEYVEKCFPGRAGNIEMEAPEADIVAGALWKNPLTQLEETVEGESEPPPAVDAKPRNARGVFVKSTEATL